MMDRISPLSSLRASERLDGPDVYGVVAEFANQGPILMEMEGQGSSYDGAMAACQRLSGQRGILRVAIVRLVLENGNALLLHDMERMQRERGA